ncbi:MULTISPECIES: ABC transporter permease [Empedobacter]|uniref:ABC-2 type transporter n=1 Tax=Empedobacter falsenii TaxID=343874 RepID=A0A376G3H3_9FLAO|nr:MULTISPECIES: ABC transporter permease [Empedobacter]STD54063.1 ABC-2 type transporter [Empedobacter falsenii]HAR72164.1 polysialic acid transporter [Flavobacteriaceae bacterium]
MSLKTVVYSSDKKTHFLKELKNIFKDISNSHFLAYQMAKRDIQAQYRQSYLGIFWAFAPVIINSLVWLFLNGSGVVSVQGVGIPYPLFVVIGTTLWSVFADTVQSPMVSVNAGKGIMSKINFPKEALLMAGMYKIFFNLGLKLILLVVFLIYFGVNLDINFLYFPFLLVVLLIFSFSLGLLITPIGLIYTDIAKIINTGISFLMYLTPVVYAMPKGGFFGLLFKLNPLTYLINDTRNSITNQPIESMFLNLLILIISIFISLIGLVVFRKSMPIIIEKISG